MAASLSQKLLFLVTPSYQPEKQTYLDLLRECVELREFRAAVFVWDRFAAKCGNPPEEAYLVMERLHSKTLPESSAVRVPLLQAGARTLAPRRRIHKIIKGWRQRKTNLVAAQYTAKARGLLEGNPKLKTMPRIPLAKELQKRCGVDFETARRLVTKLKQTGILPKETPKGGWVVPNKPRLSQFDWGKLGTAESDGSPGNPEETRGLGALFQKTKGEPIIKKKTHVRQTRLEAFFSS